MKKLFLTGIAALLMATSAAHAVDDDTCYVVRKTPDGFLAVRKKPTTGSKIIATLRPKFPLTSRPSLQFLEDNEFHLYKNWTKWTHVKGWFDNESADPGTGWVYSKYIKKVPCDDIQEEITGDLMDYKASLPPPVIEDIRQDWCKRNDPAYTAESCKELKEKKCYPWLDRCWE
jgi:hypothetical protein